MQRTPATARGRQTVQGILDAACELFGRQGVRATSLDDIQAASGTGRSQLYFYFSGKPDLVAEVVRRQAERLLDGQQPLLGAFATGAELRELFGRALIHYAQDDVLARCPIGSLVYELGEADGPAREALRDGFARWQGDLAAGLRRIEQRGELVPGHAPAAVAAALLAAYQGGILLAHTGDGYAALRSGVSLVIDAVLTPEGRPTDAHT